MTDVLTPFMVASHRFAVIFQAISLLIAIDLHVTYPDTPGLGLLIGWVVFFGAYSTYALSRHRKAIKAKAEQDKSA